MRYLPASRTPARLQELQGVQAEMAAAQAQVARAAEELIAERTARDTSEAQAKQLRCAALFGHCGTRPRVRCACNQAVRSQPEGSAQPKHGA